MRRTFFAAAALIAALPVVTGAAYAAGDSVALALDEVRTVTFKDPVATVYVGNPTIADVTMLDARHAFVQGKGYGSTNLVALNRDNKQVFNSRIAVVGAKNSDTVTLNRGTQRITLTCAGGRCEPTPTPGDDQKAFDAASAALGAHQAAARGLASALGSSRN
jgi:Flp pilus assembly secretin CpaC